MEEARPQDRPSCLQAESLSVPQLLEGVLCLERAPVEHSSSAQQYTHHDLTRGDSTSFSLFKISAGVFTFGCACVWNLSSGLQPGPCKELCEAPNWWNEWWDRRNNLHRRKSSQHSLQRVADATKLTQSLPKSLFVWVPSIAFFHERDCSCTQSQWVPAWG